MNHPYSTCARAMILVAALLTTACGGGGGGGGGSDDGNRAPTASAGVDQNVAPGAAVTLTGGGSDSDGTLASYRWRQTGGSPLVPLSGSNTANASFTAPAVTTATALAFELTVTDNDGATGTDSLTVTVTPAANVAPTANAGSDQNATSGATVTLAGAGTDSDGTIATYLWEQIGGTPTVTLTGANTTTASFTAPTVTAAVALAFRLTVTDNAGASGNDALTVTVSPTTTPVNQPPTVNAGADQNAASAAVVSLAGTASDLDGTIATYLWQQTGGSPTVTLTGANTANASFTAPTVTVSTPLAFQLTVTDNGGAATSDSLTVTVAPPPPPTTVNVSGRVTFDRVPTSASGLNYGAIRQDPARAVVVQAIAASGGSVLTQTVTDGAGNYTLTVAPNTAMSVRVLAQMLKTGSAPTWNFRVVDNTAGSATYSLAGTTFNSGTANQTRNLNAPSGFSTTGAVTGTRSAGPFAILDSIYLAYNKVLGADAAVVFAPLSVGWSPSNRPASGGGGSGTCNSLGNIGTSFYSDGNICVLGAANTDTDEYDDHVIVHEWGHYFEDNLSRSDNIGGQHGGGDRLDIRVAFGEGFGNALSGIVTDDPNYRDSNGPNQASAFTVDVDANTSPNPGWFSEDSVQSILYDLYDANPDGADAITMGFAPLYQVLRTTQRTGAPLTSIFSFIAELKTANPGSVAGINALVNAQSINGTSITAYGVGETNNGGNADTLPVYSALTVNGSAVNRCSINAFNFGNGLGTRTFFRFSVSSAGSHTFTAGSTLSDPVMVLYQAGNALFTVDSFGDGGTETRAQTLAVGDYVLEVYDYRNVFDGTPGRYCYDVRVTR